MNSSRPSPTSNSSAVAGFGTNEWLVEEMYQQYLADPSSVDQAWHDFFADYRPGSPVAASDDRETPAAEPEAAAPAPSAPAPAQPTRPSADRQQAPDQQPSAGAGAPSRATRVEERTEDTVVARASDRAVQQQPAAKAAPAAKSAPEVEPTAKPAAKPAAKADTPTGDGPKRVPLRGAAASVVKNMNASLTVPTATSVRAVPAKLLADNRIVVNNHLARSRGGKVSFTHLIGYALVRALDDFPNMNA
ncbi:MAG TPA: 2-oxo acid dehydrogenase subunit E2, partial [Geodermatophilus sp.]|nr:2-oxo acid dehydrogenase subunit E2 [Geodermatophilus sp.]